MQPEDLGKWYARNSAGEMVPFSAFATGEWAYGPQQLQRYNGVAAYEIQGSPAPGYSSGEALAAMEQLAAQLPAGIGFEWTGLTPEERISGSQAPARFPPTPTVVFSFLP